MAEGWKSDFEKLFAKCAADENYRHLLGVALAEKRDDQVLKLLDNIGVGGSPARVKALQDARVPMIEINSKFGGPTDFIAP